MGTIILPTEIIEKIIIYTDFYTAFSIGYYFVAEKLFDKEVITYEYALKKGNDSLVKFIFNQGIVSGHPIPNAILYKKYDLVVWLRNNGADMEYDLSINSAIKHSYNKIVKWLYNSRPISALYYHPMSAAIKYNNLEIVRFFNEYSNCITMSSKYTTAATSYGHLDILKYLFLEGYQVNNSCMLIACKKGYIDIVKWIHFSNLYNIGSPGAINYAAQGGHLEIIKFLSEYRSDGATKFAMDTAAENGHLETVIWLHFNRVEGCTTDAIDHASLYGRLDIVEWLYNNRDEGASQNTIEFIGMTRKLDPLKHSNIIKHLK
jgi:hypothetical protein